MAKTRISNRILTRYLGLKIKLIASLFPITSIAVTSTAKNRPDPRRLNQLSFSNISRTSIPELILLPQRQRLPWQSEGTSQGDKRLGLSPGYWISTKADRAIKLVMPRDKFSCDFPSSSMVRSSFTIGSFFLFHMFPLSMLKLLLPEQLIQRLIRVLQIARQRLRVGLYFLPQSGQWSGVSP